MGDRVLAPSAILAWTLANRIAIDTQSNLIQPIHLFLAILEILDGFYFLEAEHLGLTQEQINHIEYEIAECKVILGLQEEQITKLRRTIRQQLPISETPNKISGFLHRSDETKKLFNDSAASEGNGRVVSLGKLLTRLIPMYQSGVFTPNPDSSGEQHYENRIILSDKQIRSKESAKSRSHLLETIGHDLTELAQKGRLSPVVGRDEEIISIVRILNRTSKRNVILVGEAGVGKTAIVEGLAQKCVSKKASRELRNLHIIQINISDLISGTSYRGEMEQRLKQLITEATSDPNIIVFIDEIHLVMKSGTTGGSALDVANILKPALARDDFRCIGATTIEEYDRYIKDDSAFMRRFQTLYISEPSPEMAIQICKEWAQRIQQRLKVQISSEAIKEAVILSVKHLPSRRLPDKAIDLLEHAATSMRISSLEAEESPINDNYLPLVGVDQIRSALTEYYKIQLEPQKLLNSTGIQAALREEIIGQDQAINVLSHWIDLFSLREREVKTPLGVLLFYGPSGVGKTYFAECLAKAMNENKGVPLLRLNMNEYKESHDLSRLIGAAPGLIGHERQSLLIQFLETYPQGVILLDGLEKSHPDIIDFFASLFESGELRDSRGRLLNFRHHLFILLVDNDDEHENHINNQEELLLQNFSKKIINHFDLIIPFKKLSIEDYQALFVRKVTSLRNWLKESGEIEIVIDETTILNIVISFTENSVSVRNFLKKIDEKIVAPILEFLTKNKEVTKITIVWQNNMILICGKD
ncbi:MAG: ATP-dependent Clp protease ATP-binding subunit [Anaerolineales bacterium]